VYNRLKCSSNSANCRSAAVQAHTWAAKLPPLLCVGHRHKKIQGLDPHLRAVSSEADVQSHLERSRLQQRSALCMVVVMKILLLGRGWEPTPTTSYALSLPVQRSQYLRIAKELLDILVVIPIGFLSSQTERWIYVIGGVTCIQYKFHRCLKRLLHGLVLLVCKVMLGQ
jgi:hypothetical protein